MKIVYVTPELFWAMWTKMIPSERISAAIPTPNIVIQAENTLILLEGETCAHHLGSIEEPVSLHAIFNRIRSLPRRDDEKPEVGRVMGPPKDGVISVLLADDTVRIFKVEQ